MRRAQDQFKMSRFLERLHGHYQAVISSATATAD
jgi:hypothetical protein